MSTATRTSRYQEGSFERVKRAKGPDVWVYRWRKLQPDGRRLQRKKIIGNIEQFRTESAAKKAVENLRAEINARHDVVGKTTIEQNHNENLPRGGYGGEAGCAAAYEAALPGSEGPLKPFLHSEGIPKCGMPFCLTRN
jgi:hypothetical protein